MVQTKLVLGQPLHDAGLADIGIPDYDELALVYYLVSKIRSTAGLSRLRRFAHGASVEQKNPLEEQARHVAMNQLQRVHPIAVAQCQALCYVAQRVNWRVRGSANVTQRNGFSFQ